jgi:hypothetical protein
MLVKAKDCGWLVKVSYASAGKKGGMRRVIEKSE